MGGTAGELKRTLGLPVRPRVFHAVGAALARRELALVRPENSEEVASQLIKSLGSESSEEEEVSWRE